MYRLGLSLLLVLFGISTAPDVLAQPPQTVSQNRIQKRPTNPRSNLLPFFDQENNPVPVGFPRDRKVDITPNPPALNAFDQKVLNTCGSFGSRVSTVNLRRLFAESPEVIQSIKTAVGGEIFPGRRSDQQFRDDLVRIWSDRGGFEHIFCGEIDGSRKIGGLHFAGRYWQLQQAGIGGRLPNNSRAEEVSEGEIYTLGVEIRQGNRTIRDAKKGYSYVSNAQELLVDATRAFKQFKASGQKACLLTVSDPNATKPFKAVFVKTQSAIVTFYPDATPNPNNPSCNR